MIVSSRPVVTIVIATDYYYNENGDTELVSWILNASKKDLSDARKDLWDDEFNDATVNPSGWTFKSLIEGKFPSTNALNTLNTFKTFNVFWKKTNLKF